MALAGGVLASATLLNVPPANAQQSEDDSGLALTLSYTEELLWDDGDASARSDLGLSLISETRTQRLAFSVEGGLEKTASNGLRGTWEDPAAIFSYALDRRNSALTLDASYRRNDVDALVFSEDLGDGTLVLDEGQRETITAGLGFELGREARFGATLSLRYAETNYLDTTSTSLLDSTTDRATLGLRFDIDRRVSARLTLDHSDLNRDGGTDVRRRTLSAGATVDVTKTLVADLDLGQTRIVRDGSSPRDVDEGVYYRLALSEERPNGTLSGSLVSDIDENGRRSTARIDRSMDLPRARLTFGFGLSRHDNSDKTRPLYAFSYAQDLKRGQFSASLDQSFSTSSVGQETLNSRLRLSLSQDLTANSVLSGSLSLRDADVLGAAGDDVRQMDLTLNYSHDLTEDWTLVGGYTHSRRVRDSGNDDIDDRVFIGLRTAVTWRP